MSYNFGPPTTTAGNTFGTTTPSNGGFAFGSGDAKLSFGSTNTENKPAFNFTSPTTTAPAFGSFAFGAKTTAVTSSLFSTPATTGTGSVFGASKPLSFGGFASPPNQTVGSPGFGQPTTQNAAQNLSFGGGGIIQQQPPPAFGTATQGGGMMQQQPPPAFGTPAPQASSAFGSPAGPGFGFGQPAVTTSAFGFSTPPSGFSAPQQPISSTTSSAPQTSQAGFPLGATQGTTNMSTSASFGQASAFGKPAPAYGFGGTTSAPSFGATTATSAAPTFGTQPASTALSLGGQQAPTAFPSPNTQQQTGMSFGKPTTGLSFGQTTAPTFGTSAPPTFGTTAPPAFGTTTTGLSFGATQATTGLSFGTPSQATTGLNFGTTTTPVSSSPSFGPPSSQPGITAAPASTAQSTGISFDKKPAGLSFGAPGSTAATTSGPSFGTPANSAQTSTGLSFGTPTSTPATTGLGFGPPASTAATTGLSFGTPASTAATTGLGFGTPASTAGTTGLGFGPPASTAATTGLGFGTPASTAATTGLSFGATTSAGLSFGTTAGTGLSFAKPTATSAASSAASLASTSGIPTLGKPTATTAMMSLTTATTTTAAVPPQPFTSISFAQLEENINKWTLELEEQEKTFINQATQINAWDRLLIANGEKIVELNDAVQTVKNDQQSLEHELDFVLAQQKELEDLLAPMEKQLLEDSADRLRDPEREHMYSLAENLDAQLKQMSEDLKEVIEHLNDTNRSQDSNDPIVQIGRILNAHMSSMQWIDNSIAQISTKLDHLKATHDTLRRDNERSFQLTYN